MNNEERLKLAKGTSKKYIKEDGTFYNNLNDGKSWCPSLQARGSRYDYQEPSLKKLQMQNFKRDSFVAIDFELAYQNKDENKRFPCQIGMAVVQDGNIIKSVSYLIKPPLNEWDNKLINWHIENTNLTPKDTENEKEFNELWPEIKSYLENHFIVAYNATGTEIDILEKCLDYYNLPYPNITGYLCPYELLKKSGMPNKLDDLCERYYIDFSKNQHHDAEEDAIACAKLFLAHLNGVVPMSYKAYQEKHDTQGSLSFTFDKAEEMEQLEEKSTIDLQLPQVSDMPEFQGKTIVLTGDFNLRIKGKEVTLDHSQRTEFVKPWIESMGARVTSSISGKTDIVIQGLNPGKQDKISLEKKKGHDIKVISSEVLNTIIKECEKAADNIDQKNPLYKRRVALLGKYTPEEEKFVRYELSKRGAILTPKKDGFYQYARTTHYCILFKDVNKEDLDKINDFVFDGYHIMKVPFEDFRLLLKNENGKYYKDLTIVRSLKLSPEFLTLPRFEVKANKLNPYAQLEIYLGMNLKGDRLIFGQIMGNLGSYASPEIYDDTKILLFSDATVDNLRNGIADETISYIENHYNSQKESLGFFNYKIVTESNYLKWVLSWINRFNIQDSTLYYYNRYLESCKKE